MGNFKPTMVINYQPGDVDSYESVQVLYDFKKKVKTFDSGDFVRDWYYAIKFKLSLDKLDFDFEVSDTINNFIVDGAPFDIVWLRRYHAYKVTVPYLTDYSGNSEWPKNSMFFVEKGTTPSWEELREMCDDKKEEGNDTR